MISDVVTSIIICDGRILLLRRSDTMKSMPGLWSGVSGRMERDEAPLERARTEICEELGILADTLLLRVVGETITISAEEQQWHVHPFLFEATDIDITLNSENAEYRWIKPEDITEYDTVPGLDVVLLRLL